MNEHKNSKQVFYAKYNVNGVSYKNIRALKDILPNIKVYCQRKETCFPFGSYLNVKPVGQFRVLAKSETSYSFIYARFSHKNLPFRSFNKRMPNIGLFSLGLIK